MRTIIFSLIWLFLLNASGQSNINQITLAELGNNNSNLTYTVAESFVFNSNFCGFISGGFADHHQDTACTYPLQTLNTNFQNFNIYPNPTSNLINFQNLSQKIVKVQIVDITGNSVYLENGYDIKQISIVSVQIGMYVILLTTESGKTFKQKIIKQ